MPCWEYDIKSVRMDPVDKTKEDLNQMGLDGWELVKFVGQVDEEGMSTAFLTTHGMTDTHATTRICTTITSVMSYRPG